MQCYLETHARPSRAVGQFQRGARQAAIGGAYFKPRFAAGGHVNSVA